MINTEINFCLAFFFTKSENLGYSETFAMEVNGFHLYTFQTVKIAQ